MNEEHIRNIPFFANLESKFQRAIGKALKTETYKPDEAIFVKNTDGDALYIVIEGRISLSADDTTTLANLGAGSLLGEAEFFQGTPHTVTARALTDVTVSVLEATALETLIRNNVYLGLALSQNLGLPIAQMTGYVAEKLGKVSFLKSLSAAELGLIAAKMVARQMEANEAIYRENDPASGMYLIEEGHVRLLGSDDGDYTELAAGEVFGEMAALANKPHADTAQTAKQTVLWHLPMADFAALGRQHPEIRAALSRTITARLSAADREYALDLLRQIPLFSQLSDDALADTAAHLILRHVPAQQTIFQIGDHGDAMFIIESGQIELTNDQGLTRRLETGGFLGEMALMTGKSRTEIARATQETNLWALYRADFDTLLVKYPQLSAALSQSLRDRLNTTSGQFIEKHLKKLAVLGGLSRLQLDKIAARLQSVHFQAGDVVFAEGQPGNELFFIENGQVERFASAPGGFVALPELETGDFLGETALLSGRPHATTAKAKTDVDIWTLAREDFDDLVYQYPNLSAILNRTMSDRLVETMEIIRTVPAQAAIPAQAGGRPAAQPRRRTSGMVPPVPVRPVAPPPSPFARASRPVSRRASGPVPPQGKSRSARPVSGAVRPASRKVKPARPSKAAKSAKSAKSAARSRKAAASAGRKQAKSSAPSGAASVAKGAKKVGRRVQRRVDGFSHWYANMPLGTRVGLVVLMLLLVWMCFIASSASVISALAAPLLGQDGQLLNGDESGALASDLSQTDLVASLPFVETTTPTPTITPSPTDTATPSPTVTQTPIPTFTPSPTYTPTPVDTPTITPTPTSTNTPTPTPIPPTNTPAYRAPTNTPEPTATPTPNVDFRLVKFRKLTACENEGNHHIYLRVIDANGNGLNNIPVRINWGKNSNDGVTAKTEAKDKGDGFIEFAMFKGSYSVQVLAGSSEVKDGITPDFQVDERCDATGNPVGNSLYHASFEVVFQRRY